MKNKLLLIITAIFIFIAACNMPDFEGPDNWEFDFYGPIIINQTSLEDLAELEDIVFVYELRTNSIGIPVGTSPVPPIPPMPEFYAETFKLTDHFVWVHADSLVFDMTITNKFPINIKAGTTVRFRNNMNNELVYEHEIQENIEPNESYHFTDLLSDQFVESDVDFYIDGFHSDGSSEPVTITSDDGADFEFVLSFIKLHSLMIKTNQNYTVDDTSEVFIEIDEENENIADGIIEVYILNKFPIKMEFQLYFLDEFFNVKDSLFDFGRAVIVPAELGAESGTVNEASVVEDKHTIMVNAEKIRAIGESEFVRPYFNVNTDHLTEHTRINADESYLGIQITSDIKLSIKLK